MAELQFDARGLDPGEVSRWRRMRRPPSKAPAVTAAVCALVAVVYTTNHPGQFTIAVSADGPTTEARYVDVTGQVENAAIRTVTLSANGSDRRVTVTEGRFATRVPLVRGINTISATVGGVASLVTSGSNIVTLDARIPPSDIWSELTWDGPGDIDLHLYLPNNEHCYFDNDVTDAGAFLDFDNTESDGPEHIVMDNAIEGTYRMTVHYFAAKGPVRPVRWNVTLQLRGGRTLRSFSGVLTEVNEEQEFWTTNWTIP